MENVSYFVNVNQMLFALLLIIRCSWILIRKHKQFSSDIKLVIPIFLSRMVTHIPLNMLLRITNNWRYIWKYFSLLQCVFQGHPADRFGKLSVRKAFNPLWFSWENWHLELSWYEKFKVCCFRTVENVVLSTKKRSAIIFGKAIRPKVFGKWTKKP